MITLQPKEKLANGEPDRLDHWWISQGAGFTKRVKHSGNPIRLKPILLALQQVPSVKKNAKTISRRGHVG